MCERTAKANEIATIQAIIMMEMTGQSAIYVDKRGIRLPTAGKSREFFQTTKRLHTKSFTGRCKGKDH